MYPNYQSVTIQLEWGPEGCLTKDSYRRPTKWANWTNWV